MLKIAAPRSLAAVPLLLLADEKPDAYAPQLFSDHAEAVRGLDEGHFDLLATGFTELPASRLVCTYVWGLSALLVRDSSIKSVADLSLYCTGDSGADIVLPFRGSPLDLQVRAVFARLLPGAQCRFSNQPLPETLAQFMAGKVAAAVLPEPMATTLELAGKATRLSDLADLYQRVQGDARSPQVGLFAAPSLQLPADFLPQLGHSVGRSQAMTPAQRDAIAAALNISAALLERALPHVRFAMPAAEVAQSLENAYRQFIATPAPTNHAPA